MVRLTAWNCCLMRPFITILIIFVLIVGASACMAGDAPKNPKSNIYNGAWFKIEYPPKFSVVAFAKSSTATNGYDGVKFVNKEGVEFFVYSPQWSGEEKD